MSCRVLPPNHKQEMIEMTKKHIFILEKQIRDETNQKGTSSCERHKVKELGVGSGELYKP